MVINEAPEHQPPPPDGVPHCSGFVSDKDTKKADNKLEGKSS